MFEAMGDLRVIGSKLSPFESIVLDVVDILKLQCMNPSA